MKKIICMFLTLLLSVCIVGCSQTKDSGALSTAAVKRAAWASVRVRMASLWPVE